MTFALPIIAAIVISNAPTYKVAVQWPAVTNAIGYACEWQGTNGVKQSLAMTNGITLTNLAGGDPQFRALAYGSGWVTPWASLVWAEGKLVAQRSQSLGGPWTSMATNSFTPTGALGFFRLQAIVTDGNVFMVKEK